MAVDNKQMWKELGIDLEQHDLLLNALGPIFQEIYLSQENRPNMSFFDFVVSDIAFDIKYELVKNLILQSRTALGNSFRFDSSYRFFSQLFSIYWSFF